MQSLLDWLIASYRVIARALAVIGASAIVFFSMVPAADRPVTGLGQSFEHLAAFTLVAGTFAIGYQLSLVRQLIAGFLFCCGVELIQVPLPTRHARLSDLIIDICASSIAIVIVRGIEMFASANLHANKPESEAEKANKT